MKRMQFFIAGFVFLIVLFYEGRALAQDVPLPMDTSVRYKTLANGFSYYVRKNTSSKNMVSVSFVVKAGFLQEDEDQLELSHLLEHVALTSTKHYPQGAFYYLKKLGMRMGDQLNASTGYLNTHYRFEVPSDSVNAISLALRIARDIATNVNFKDSTILTERLAVTTEKLGALGIDQREIEDVVPKLFGNTYYAKRGIGTFSVEVFNKTSNKSLIRFYRDWYRPDLESIMVVGNIDEQKIAREIEQLFSSIPAPRQPRPYVNHQMYDKGKVKYLLHTDAQLKDLSISMYTRLPEEQFSTMAHLEQLVKRKLLGELTKRRLADISKIPNGDRVRMEYSFLREGLGSSPGINVGRVVVRPTSAQDIERCAIDMIGEMERIKQFGFLSAELTAAKLKFINELGSGNDKSSAAFIQDYIDHMTRGYVFLSPEVYTREFLYILSRLDLSTMNAYARQVLIEVDPDVVILAPESKKDSLPSRIQWESFIQKAKKGPLPAYVPSRKAEYTVVTPVLKDPVSIVSRAIHSGITELILGNGVHIVLKPSKGESNNNKICVNVFSKVGAGHYSDSTYYAAINSARIIEDARKDSLKKTGVYSSLAERGVSVRADINDFGVGVRGYSRVADLDILMSLIYSYFNKPQVDRPYFDEWISRNALIKTGSNPLQTLADSIRRFAYENLRYVHEEKQNNIDFKTVCRSYCEMFSDNSGAFTFLVTGYFDEDKVIPIILRYAGALTGSKSFIAAQSDAPIQISNEVVHKTLYSGVEQKAVVELRLAEPLQYGAGSIFGIRFLEWFLEKQLISRLREKEGGLYGIAIVAKMFPGPNDRLVLSIRFECPVDRAQVLLSAARDEIDVISKQGASKSDMAEYLAYARQSRESLMRANLYWRYLLDEVYYLGNGVSEVSEIIDMEKNGMKDFDMNLFLRNILNESRFSDFLLLPSI